MIITTGGTGLAPRDVTPEATLAVIDKRCGGIETALHVYGLQVSIGLTSNCIVPKHFEISFQITKVWLHHGPLFITSSSLYAPDLWFEPLHDT